MTPSLPVLPQCGQAPELPPSPQSYRASSLSPEPAPLVLLRSDESIPAPTNPFARAPTSHARKQPPNHIPRPRNSFIIFRTDFVNKQKLTSRVEKDHRNISKIVGQLWAALSDNDKKQWEERARLEKMEHQRLYPNYKYTPVARNNPISRRKVKKETLKEKKRVANIAQLLQEGRTGEDLEQMVVVGVDFADGLADVLGTDKVKSNATKKAQHRVSRPARGRGRAVKKEEDNETLESSDEEYVARPTRTRRQKAAPRTKIHRLLSPFPSPPPSPSPSSTPSSPHIPLSTLPTPPPTYRSSTPSPQPPSPTPIVEQRPFPNSFGLEEGVEASSSTAYPSPSPEPESQLPSTSTPPQALTYPSDVAMDDEDIFDDPVYPPSFTHSRDSIKIEPMSPALLQYPAEQIFDDPLVYQPPTYAAGSAPWDQHDAVPSSSLLREREYESHRSIYANTVTTTTTTTTMTTSTLSAPSEVPWYPNQSFSCANPNPLPLDNSYACYNMPLPTPTTSSFSSQTLPASDYSPTVYYPAYASGYLSTYETAPVVQASDTMMEEYDPQLVADLSQWSFPSPRSNFTGVRQLSFDFLLTPDQSLGAQQDVPMAPLMMEQIQPVGITNYDSYVNAISGFDDMIDYDHGYGPLGAAVQF